MISYVAFLRGINVGGNRRIKMEDLRKAFELLGFQHVRTLLAAGNVVFETPEANVIALGQKIEAKLAEVFGYDIGVILRTLDDIREIAGADPFKGITVTPDTRLYVTFLKEKPESALKIPYESPQKDFRILRVTTGEVFSILTLSPNSRSVDAMNVLEKEFGRRITTRNWNTVVKILDS
jgi:uncharacterized protein (DUF1697 family)